jgi:hypothetical protein
MENNSIAEQDKLSSDALLYVLNDPSLDRDAFEVQLADDMVLGEMVSEAARWVFDIKSLGAISCQTGKVSVASPVSAEAASPSVCPSWIWICALAASIAMVAGVSWRFGRIGSNDQKLTANVVNAWADLQSEMGDSNDPYLDSRSKAVFVPETELMLEENEVAHDSDLPTWLVAATVAMAPVQDAEVIQ